MALEFNNAAELREHYKRLKKQFYPHGKGFGREFPAILTPPPPPEPDAPAPIVLIPPAPARPLLVRSPEDLAEQARLTDLHEQRIMGLLGPLRRIQPRPTMRFIQNAVASVWQVSTETMCGKSRLPEIIIARHAAMFLCRVAGLRSYPEIGRAFGGRDHTTAFHACGKYAHLLGLPRGSKLPLPLIMAPIGQEIAVSAQPA